MKLKLPKNLSQNIKNFSGTRLVQFLCKLSHYLLWIIFLVVMAFLALIWYRSTNDYSWSDEKKMEYRKEYAGQTTFREERFNATVKSLEERVQLHQTLPAVKKDIFFGVSL